MLINLQQNLRAKYLLIILSIIAGYLVLILLDNFSFNNFHIVCFFKSITHIACPGCGMGHATLALLKGNISASLSYNILCIPFTLAILISFIWLLFDMVKNRETFLHFVKQDISVKYKYILLFIIVVDWTINIIRI